MVLQNHSSKKHHFLTITNKRFQLISNACNLRYSSEVDAFWFKLAAKRPL